MSFGTRIRQVECILSGHELTVTHPLCSQLQTLRGSRLLFRDFTQDEHVAALLYLEDTQEVFDIQRVEKSLSGVITVFLSDQPPLYRMKQGEQVFLVAAGGGFRSDNALIQVPLVMDLSGVYQDQQTVVHQFLERFLRNLGEHQQKISQIELVSPEQIELSIPGFPRVIVELRQSPENVARQLVLVLEQLVPEETDPALVELDLRFALPVLRTYRSDPLFSATDTPVESAPADEADGAPSSTDSAQVLIDSQE